MSFKSIYRLNGLLVVCRVPKILRQPANIFEIRDDFGPLAAVIFETLHTRVIHLNSWQGD